MNKNRTSQNNKRADRKMESNDSPEIPDRGETSEETGGLPVPSGCHCMYYVTISVVFLAGSLQQLASSSRPARHILDHADWFSLSFRFYEDKQ